MTVKEQIKKHIAGQPEAKRGEMEALHKLLLKISPKCRLWFEDGKNDAGKVVANPTIGYGFFIIKYATGKTKEFFRIGISGNTTGISVYVLGLKDKKYLAKTFGKKIGKAIITGYCIKFKTLNNINIDVLKEAISYGLEAQN